jgi:hypothetical protein
MQSDLSIRGFIENYFPLIEKIFPRFELIVAGSNPSGKLLQLCEEFENISKWHAKAIVGTADQIEEKLSSMAKQHGIDEFVINTWTYDFESRVRSYQLLSKLIK